MENSILFKGLNLYYVDQVALKALEIKRKSDLESLIEEAKK